MRATTFNHVSIRARSLAASVWFYTEIFGMERIPFPKLANEVPQKEGAADATLFLAS